MEQIMIRDDGNKMLLLITGDGKDYYIIEVDGKVKKKVRNYKTAVKQYNLIPQEYRFSRCPECED